MAAPVIRDSPDGGGTRSRGSRKRQRSDEFVLAVYGRFGKSEVLLTPAFARSVVAAQHQLAQAGEREDGKASRGERKRREESMPVPEPGTLIGDGRAA